MQSSPETTLAQPAAPHFLSQGFPGHQKGCQPAPHPTHSPSACGTGPTVGRFFSPAPRGRSSALLHSQGEGTQLAVVCPKPGGSIGLEQPLSGPILVRVLPLRDLVQEPLWGENEGGMGAAWMEESST